MRDVVDIVTDRPETSLVTELAAARGSLASEYPDAPRADPGRDDGS